MKNWTWGELKKKIQEENDLQAENFIDEEELIEYVNEAIDFCEALILQLGQDYFLSEESLSIVSGTSEYDLPEDIYAKKIRRVLLEDGYETYTVNRLKDLSSISTATDSDDIRNCCYLVTNKSTGRKMNFYPTPRSNSTLRVFYIRNARRLSINDGDSQTCDIPEFIPYVTKYVRKKVAEKERDSLLPIIEQDLSKVENQLKATLSIGEDDEDNVIEPDLDLYNDFVGAY